MPILKNTRHERFAINCASGLAQNKAYSGAGFKPNRANAAKLRKRKEVDARISELVTELQKEIKIEAHELIKEIKSRYGVDMVDIAQWDKNGKVTLTPSKDLSAAQRKAISELRVDKTGKLQIKLYGMDKFIELGGRSIAFFRDKVEIEAGEKLSDLICAANKLGGKKSNPQ